MRQIELTMRDVRIPRRDKMDKDRPWDNIRDYFRARWLASYRQPFGGRVSLSYRWDTYQVVCIEWSVEIAARLAELLAFMLKPDASYYIGEARCEWSRNLKLTIRVSGDFGP